MVAVSEGSFQSAETSQALIHSRRCQGEASDVVSMSAAGNENGRWMVVTVSSPRDTVLKPFN